MNSSTYQAYLLRLWWDGEQQPWRALLENPYTGERHGFASLEQLFVYLQEQTASANDGPGKRTQES